MSQEYTPDAWVILEILQKGEKLHKVLAGWRGGYLGQETWQLNSGIVKICDKDSYWEIVGYSGSVYYCYKDSCGLTSLTSGVLHSMYKKSELLQVSITEVDIENIADQYRA